MNADDRGLGVDIAHDEGDRALDGLAVRLAGLGETFEAENAEVPPARGEVGVGNLRDTNQRHNKIIDS